jgi:hypothetical protein
MSTARRRVNLSLTEFEERFLGAITTAGTAEHDAVMRYIESLAAGTGVPARSSLGPADVVHVLLRMGMDRLEYEVAEISYAAEAAACEPEDEARIAAMEGSFIETLARGHE